MPRSSPARSSPTTVTRSPSSCADTSPRFARACAGSPRATTHLPTTWRRRPSCWHGATSASYRQEAKFSTWLYRIATNCWLADARKRKEELLGDTADDLAEASGTAFAADAAVPDHARGATMKLDLERALAALSEGERAAIVQCYYNDLSHEEAAFVLGMPVGTVKTHVLRGKQKLKAALAAWAPRQESRR